MPQQQRISDAIDAYLAMRKQQDFKANTIRQARVALGQFLTTTGNIFVASIERRHVEDFFAEYADRWSAATTNLRASQLRPFFDFCRRRNWMAKNHDPMEEMRARKVVDKPRLRLPVTDFKRALDTAENFHRRDRLIVALGLFLFLRAGEACTLKIGDVNLDQGEVTIMVHKSNLVDVMPISAPLDAELRAWLTYYTEMVGVLHPDMLLVPALAAVVGDYDPVSKRLVNMRSNFTKSKPRPYAQLTNPARIIQRTLTAMGHGTFQEGFHTLRRSGARALFDELCEVGFDRALEIVSAMLHHKQMSTTQIYLGITESKAKRDDLIKGKPMFSGMASENVISLTSRTSR